MKPGYMNIHVVPGTEHLVTVLASVRDHSGEMFVLHVFDGAAPITVHFTAQSASDGSRSNFRTFLEVGGDHGCHVLQV